MQTCCRPRGDNAGTGFRMIFADEVHLMPSMAVGSSADLQVVYHFPIRWASDAARLVSESA